MFLKVFKRVFSTASCNIQATTCFQPTPTNNSITVFLPLSSANQPAVDDGNLVLEEIYEQKQVAVISLSLLHRFTQPHW